jgi:hypothetical protein
MGLIEALGWERCDLRRFPSGDAAIIAFVGEGADAASMVENARHSFSAVRSRRPSSYASEQVTHSRICCSVSRLFARSSSWSR